MKPIEDRKPRRIMDREGWKVERRNDFEDILLIVQPSAGNGAVARLNLSQAKQLAEQLREAAEK